MPSSPTAGPPVAVGGRTISITDPLTGTTVGYTPTITGIESNAAGVVTVDVYDKNGTIVHQCFAQSTWKCTLPGLPAALGPYVVDANRVGGEHHAISINTTDPLPPPTPPTPPLNPPMNPLAPLVPLLPAPIVPPLLPPPINPTGSIAVILMNGLINAILPSKVQALAQVVAAMSASPSGHICVSWADENQQLQVPNFGDLGGGAGVDDFGGRFPGAPGYGGN